MFSQSCSFTNQQMRHPGSGKYADIFEAVRMSNLKKCIIRPAKEAGRPGIEQDIKILRSLSGGPNILELEDIVRDNEVTFTLWTAMQRQDRVETLIIVTADTSTDGNAFLGV